MLEKFSLSEPITMSSEAASERKRVRQSAGPHECPGRKCCGVLVTLARGSYDDHTRRRQPSPCPQIQTALEEGSQLQNSPGMASSCAKPHLIISLFVGCLLFASPARPAVSPSAAVNSTTLPVKHSRISAHLKRVNKPASPDGDLIDCVPSHLQPAFDHPKLRDHKPSDPPERPKGYSLSSTVDASFQAWSISGESCPEGTVPIRRTTREDMLRASSVQRFGRKPAARRLRRDSTSTGHEHAVGYIIGDQYYGAKASLSVWAPRVTSASEFSLSQIWVISGSFGNDLNTIEAGWQVSPQLYGDNRPRFFTYWTSDAYQETGCYNLLCSGFVQTNNRIAIGAAISPTSALNGGQFDIDLLVWKDPKHGHWWLELGSGLLVGYWPSFLFSHLAEHANMVQFGGEIVNAQTSGFHTSTQMGSGHFAGEGFRKASYFRNLQLVDWDNSLIPLSNLRLLADHPNCYSIQGGVNAVWGNYFYYGGPGRNVRCP
ncbi:hypothetical protein MUK42_30112 [Musa troglodytarum]|uniref:Neprosin PEP catalytic domain-containing protein n=1 Tax=Musa troglodytarum TaxID=320322 RepID=A0A9E7HB57_9LILI|nr:hypothetical protein MUK42_30112 [Musa troglodytarum]